MVALVLAAVMNNVDVSFVPLPPKCKPIQVLEQRRVHLTVTHSGWPLGSHGVIVLLIWPIKQRDHCSLEEGPQDLSPGTQYSVTHRGVSSPARPWGGGEREISK